SSLTRVEPELRRPGLGDNAYGRPGDRLRRRRTARPPGAPPPRANPAVPPVPRPRRPAGPRTTTGGSSTFPATTADPSAPGGRRRGSSSIPNSAPPLVPAKLLEHLREPDVPRVEHLPAGPRRDLGQLVTAALAEQHGEHRHLLHGGRQRTGPRQEVRQ